MQDICKVTLQKLQRIQHGEYALPLHRLRHEGLHMCNGFVGALCNALSGVYCRETFIKDYSYAVYLRNQRLADGADNYTLHNNNEFFPSGAAKSGFAMDGIDQCDKYCRINYDTHGESSRLYPVLLCRNDTNGSLRGLRNEKASGPSISRIRSHFLYTNIRMHCVW